MVLLMEGGGIFAIKAKKQSIILSHFQHKISSELELEHKLPHTLSTRPFSSFSTAHTLRDSPKEETFGRAERETQTCRTMKKKRMMMSFRDLAKG